nr:MAG TPA: hypothetical protein [Inoviridae sp.]
MGAKPISRQTSRNVHVLEITTLVIAELQSRADGRNHALKQTVVNVSRITRFSFSQSSQRNPQRFRVVDQIPRIGIAGLLTCAGHTPIANNCRHFEHP